MSPRVFCKHIKAGDLPEPALGKGRGAIWDRHEIDAALDRRMTKKSDRAAADSADELISRTKEFFKT